MKTVKSIEKYLYLLLKDLSLENDILILLQLIYSVELHPAYQGASVHNVIIISEDRLSKVVRESVKL